MMYKLATFVMSGRLQAVVVVVGAAVLALLFPPVMLISGAALVLVTLRLGATQGLGVLAISVVLTGLLAILLPGLEALSLIYSMLQWLPLLLVSLILRYTISLGYSLVAAAAVGVLVILAMHISIADLDHFWTIQLDAYVRPSLEQLELAGNRIDQLFQQLALLMTGKLVASSLLVLAMMLLLGRWWQALLYNPGGFRSEFRSLTLGYPAAISALTLLVATLISDSQLLTELTIVGAALFFLQGMAVLHCLAAVTASPTAWLVFAYVLLFILPPVMAGLAALGLIDTFAQVRKRLRA